jgi:hypothetical protein
MNDDSRPIFWQAANLGRASNIARRRILAA